MLRTISRGAMSVSSFHSGTPGGVDDRRERDVDDTLLGAEPAQLRITREGAPERRRMIEDLVDIAPDDEWGKGADRGGADFVAAPDGEGEPVALGTGVGVQDDVGGGVVRIGVDRVGAVAGQRSREAQVDDLETGNPHCYAVRPDRKRSSATAATMIPPVTICCTQLGSPFCVQPVWITVMIAAPMIVPSTVPRPPVRLPPPMMTAAMTSSSRPTATVGSPTESFENCSRPAMPASAPEIV